MNIGSRCNGLISDSYGNRFLSTIDGRVLRLGDELLFTPTITNPPIGKITFAGSNHVFSVGGQGSGPLRYYWLLNGAPLPGKTNATLDLNNLTSGQSGDYSVIVSNFVGSVTSTPVVLEVKNVALFLGNQMLTNGSYNFLTPPTLTIGSVFANGSKFYTLDNSTPDFAATFYTAPFTVSTSATVRALGYSADFSQSEEADPVRLDPPLRRAVSHDPHRPLRVLQRNLPLLRALPIRHAVFQQHSGHAHRVIEQKNVATPSHFIGEQRILNDAHGVGKRP
jgi:hypothetical protein